METINFPYDGAFDFELKNSTGEVDAAENYEDIIVNLLVNKIQVATYQASADTNIIAWVPGSEENIISCPFTKSMTKSWNFGILTAEIIRILPNDVHLEPEIVIVGKIIKSSRSEINSNE